jgi:broad specificity phosphatase PhoE
MRLLYLVRHASPTIQPTVPAHEWALSDRGIEEARAVGEAAKRWGLQALYSSTEKKAEATALLIGDAVGLPVRLAGGFEELRMPWIGNADAFAETVRDILFDPERTVPGAESAGAAAARFDAGVRVVEEGAFPAAIVTHGRVMMAWLATRFSLDDPFALWRALPMPGWVVVDLDAPVQELRVQGIEG